MRTTKTDQHEAYPGVRPDAEDSQACTYVTTRNEDRIATIDVAEAKRRVCAEVDGLASTLLDVSHQIHDNPELCFEEIFTHDLLTTVIADHGFAVERGAYGLDTAFEARAGAERGPAIAVVCEYDALPDIGRACGHNIIAAAGLGGRSGGCCDGSRGVRAADAARHPCRGRRRQRTDVAQ